MKSSVDWQTNRGAQRLFCQVKGSPNRESSIEGEKCRILGSIYNMIDCKKETQCVKTNLERRALDATICHSAEWVALPIRRLFKLFEWCAARNDKEYSARVLEST